MPGTPVKKSLKFLIYIVPFHRFFVISKALYNNIYPPGSGLSLCHSFMRRSHPLSDQLPGEHTGHLAAISCFPVSAMNLFGMHIFLQSPSSARYSFYQPTEGWKAESTCQQWGSNLPPLAQESDALLTELTWLSSYNCILMSNNK